MPRTIRFHLDENCPRALATALRRRGIDVTTTPEVGLLAATDATQAAHVSGQGRILFTQDEDFLVIHAAGVPHPGIVYCKKNARSLGDLIRALTLLWEIYEPEEMADRVEFL